MSSINGKLTTCDRCGATVFQACTGEGERDGGYTRWNTFEPAVGWKNTYEAGTLCPNCYESYEEVLRMFKNGTIGCPIENKQPNH